MEAVIVNRVILSGVVLMFSSLISSNSLARGLDYDAMAEHSFNLSGRVVSLALPGGLDKGFRVKPGLESLNVYDNEKYRDDYYQPVLLERHWDYRGYFWQGEAGRFAMMRMVVALSRLPEQESLNIADDMAGFEKTIIQRIRSEHEEDSRAEYPISISCDTRTVDGVPVLACMKKDEAPYWAEDVFKYVYVPVFDQVFLAFSFKVSPLGNEKSDNRSKWYPQSLEDIDKIIDSVRIVK